MIISVVVPTFNRAERVASLVSKFLSLGDQEFEIIVVDDGSTDNTLSELSRIVDDRLKLISVSNGERGRARNIGASHAIGDYINFFDSDDFPKNNYLHAVREILASSGQPDWLILGYDIQTPSGLSVTPRFPSVHSHFLDVLQYGNPLSPNSIFIKTPIFSSFQFNEDRSLAGSEDYELWLRLGMRIKPVYCPNIVISSINQWQGRSVNNISPVQSLRQFRALTISLNALEWPHRLAEYRRKIFAGNCMYFSLQASYCLGTKLSSIWLLLLSLSIAPRLALTKRPFAVLKHLLLTYR